MEQDGVDLHVLRLGAPAAERDEGLESYFVESDAYRRVAEGSKTIILGNRGAGKSAIFEVLAKREESAGTTVIRLAPEDYSYELLSSSMIEEKKGSWVKTGAYASAWKYTIYVLVMKAICAKSFRLRRGAASDIYRYVRDHHEDRQMSKLSSLISYLKRIESIKLGSYEARVKVRELEKLYKLDEINGLLPKVRELLHEQPVIAIVDELDKGWDASEDAQAFVAGLFQACNSINQLSPNLRVYMSLRQELYDNIPALYDDAQKYRDIIETISWDETGLRNLISKRIRYATRNSLEGDDEDVWNAVYSETLEYRRTKSFNYIVDRTLYRPREIIQFCNQSIETAVADRQSTPINYSTIGKAEQAYSKDRTLDISAEYRFQYPGLLSIFESFRGLVYNMTREQLEYRCLEIITGDVATDAIAHSWLENLDPDHLVEVLWRVGFLRARAIGGVKAQRRSGSSYLASHQAGNLSLININSFQVHPMFRVYLGLREPKS